MKKILNLYSLLQITLLLLGIALLIFGLVQGDDLFVQSRTSVVCLSCIGLG